jgi:hypothetical protein
MSKVRDSWLTWLFEPYESAMSVPIEVLTKRVATAPMRDNILEASSVISDETCRC